MTISVEPITMERERARELWRNYQTHRHYETPIDREIARTYHLLSQGRVVIKALESVVKAGLGTDLLPKLAVVRADAIHCWLRPRADGGAQMQTQASVNPTAIHNFIRFPAGSFPGIAAGRWEYKALVPLIPSHLRPKRGLANYHILYEAEWAKVVPVDPMLLRRIGKSDMWVVVAAWDLTEVERAAMAQRLQL